MSEICILKTTMILEADISRIPLEEKENGLKEIANKIYRGERISKEEGIYLFENGDLSFLVRLQIM